MSRTTDPTGLILPPSIQTRQRKYRCNICDTLFPLEQRSAFERHIVKCAERNHDQVEADFARKEESYLTSSADPEKFVHFRNGGN